MQQVIKTNKNFFIIGYSLSTSFIDVLSQYSAFILATADAIKQLEERYNTEDLEKFANKSREVGNVTSTTEDFEKCTSHDNKEVENVKYMDFNNLQDASVADTSEANKDSGQVTYNIDTGSEQHTHETDTGSDQLTHKTDTGSDHHTHEIDTGSDQCTHDIDTGSDQCTHDIDTGSDQCTHDIDFGTDDKVEGKTTLIEFQNNITIDEPVSSILNRPSTDTLSVVTPSIREEPQSPEKFTEFPISQSSSTWSKMNIELYDIE